MSHRVVRVLPSTVSSKKKKPEEKGQVLVDLADGLTNLVDKAYPELEIMAKEQLALYHFLSQIESPHLAFSARQKCKCPKTIDICKVDPNDAVDAIEEPKPIGANAVTSLPDMMKQVMDRLEKPEARIDQPASQALDQTILLLRVGTVERVAILPVRACSSSVSGKRVTLDGLSPSV